MSFKLTYPDGTIAHLIDPEKVGKIMAWHPEATVETVYHPASEPPVEGMRTVCDPFVDFIRGAASDCVEAK